MGKDVTVQKSLRFYMFSLGANHVAVVLATSLSTITFVMLLTASVVLGKKKLVKKQNRQQLEKTL